ncbi:uracil-DNA glycosylase-like protein [Cubamyces lactineus]|nr:uracil-DNA glycosylase-like protein [Cubamyces lactineus]
MKGDSNPTPAVTPTQILRDKLSAFRFDEKSTPSLRRSPRNHTSFKAEETESELPTASTPARRKRAASGSAVAVGPDVKKAKSLSRPKLKKASRGIAPPEKYAHLDPLNDYLGQEPDMLDILFCGINPGQMSATVGHHFAHPTNHFWACLYGGGLTDRLLSASEDYTLPDRHNYGMTNLVERPSAQAAELANNEFTAGVPALLQKITRKRPRIVCFVGKGIWDSFIKAAAPSPVANEEPSSGESQPVEPPTGAAAQADGSDLLATKAKASKKIGSRAKTTKQKGKVPKEPFVFDLQPYKVVHSNPAAKVRETLFFVVVSTSGLVAGYQRPEKIKQFALLKQRLDELKDGTLDTSTMTVIPIPEHMFSL